MKLSTKIIALSILTCILPMCIAFPMLYESVQKNVRAQGEDFCRYSTMNMASMLEGVFDAAYDVSMSVLASEPVREYLEHPGKGDDLRERAENALYTIGQSGHAVTSVTVFSEGGTKVSYGRNGSLWEEDRRRADELDGLYFWGVDAEGLMQGQPFLCRLLRDSQKVRTHWGYVKVYLSAGELRRILGAEATGGRMAGALTDGEDGILFSGSVPMPAAEHSFSLTHTFSHCQWQLLTRLGEDDIYNAGALLRSTLVSALVLSLLAGAVLSVVLSHLLTRPIRRLNRAVSEVASGHFGVHVEKIGKDELGQLAVQVNHMSDELMRLLNEAVENRTMFISAKLRSLQSQINPHFLYNTLDNIHWMCEMRHMSDVGGMVASLSRLFKLSLSVDETGVWPLDREIEHVRCYLDILNVRHQGTIRFDLKVQEGLSSVPVPALLLQPLIENAIQHGVRDLEQGLVQVEILREGKQLVYRVRDNGSADAPYINGLIQHGPAPGTRRGMALYNLKERLRLRFGGKAQFFCVSDEAGSLFELRMPMEGEENQ